MLSRGILCYQIHQRELVDNLKLRERQVEIEEINDRIKAEEQRLDGLDVNNLIRERDVLEREMEKLIAEVVFDFSAVVIMVMAMTVMTSCCSTAAATYQTTLAHARYSIHCVPGDAPFSLGDQGPHSVHGFLIPPKSTPQMHLNRFCCVSTAHGCDHTNQTHANYAASITIGCILLCDAT